MFKLEKKIKFYKSQFDESVFERYESHVVDRLSIDLDSLLFLSRYILKHNKDLDKLDEIEKEFTGKSSALRKVFGEVIYFLLIDKLRLGSNEDIVDILTSDMKIDTTYISFTINIISENEEFLNRIDSICKDDELFNLYPNKFFRFTSDSYNDGIAKAYPELFADRSNNRIGVGRDHDVFCHSLTLQTSEACSLQCLYCLSGDTLIEKANGSVDYIKNIRRGDMVLAFKESIGDKKGSILNIKFKTDLWAEVTRIMHRKVKGYFLISHPKFRRSLKITGEHPVLTEYGWMEVCVLRYDYGIAYLNRNNEVEFVRDYDIEWKNEEIEVYNLETTKSTYIANRFLVHNCYQFNKTPMRMNFDTAKSFIDKLLNDEYGYINKYNSPALILEFIGGEPLMEIKLTRRIYEYFLDRCYELNHPWFKFHRVSICSNGMQYFDKEVQDFFKEYSCNISFNISIDGNKELHDACRKQPNGEGSYDIDMLALNHYNKHFTPERNSKMTLAPQNMKYLFESVKSFINNGMNSINLNCVFEEGWNRKTALLEYTELKKLADYILENDLENLYISIFNERQEDVQEKSVDGNFCGAGSASMLAVRPNGQFYPCIRYMPTSIGSDKDDLCLGTVDTKLIGREEGSEIIKMLDRNTRRGQVNDICYNCPIGNDCPSCSALGVTVFNDNNKKVTFICIQMIAEALANVYYWNLLSIKHPEYNLPVRKNNVPDEWSLLVIDKEELDFLKKIELSAMMNELNNKI